MDENLQKIFVDIVPQALAEFLDSFSETEEMIKLLDLSPRIRSLMDTEIMQMNYFLIFLRNLIKSFERFIYRIDNQLKLEHAPEYDPLNDKFP